MARVSGPVCADSLNGWRLRSTNFTFASFSPSIVVTHCVLIVAVVGYDKKLAMLRSAIALCQRSAHFRSRMPQAFSTRLRCLKNKLQLPSGSFLKYEDGYDFSWKSDSIT